MTLHVSTDRAIHTNGNGGLEIIDDVDAEDDHQKLLEAFAVPTAIVDMKQTARELWRLMQDHVPSGDNVLIILPGNGGWLVEQTFDRLGMSLPSTMPVDVSRVSDSAIEIDGSPDHIVIIEDVVETGGTALKLRGQLAHIDCPVTLATTWWHDRASQTAEVEDIFGGYHQVLVAHRVRSSHPSDDVRSLSTLARKATIPKNQRYSSGRERIFVEAMHNVLTRHDWLNHLGVTLGYRLDPDVIREPMVAPAS